MKDLELDELSVETNEDEVVEEKNGFVNYLKGDFKDKHLVPALIIIIGGSIIVWTFSWLQGLQSGGAKNKTKSYADEEIKIERVIEEVNEIVPLKRKEESSKSTQENLIDKVSLDSVDEVKIIEYATKDDLVLLNEKLDYLYEHMQENVALLKNKEDIASNNDSIGLIEANAKNLKEIDAKVKALEAKLNAKNKISKPKVLSLPTPKKDWKIVGMTAERVIIKDAIGRHHLAFLGKNIPGLGVVNKIEYNRVYAGKFYVTT